MEAVVEEAREDRRLREWRERRMLEVCDGDAQIALELLVARVDYHDMERARADGCPVRLLARIFA